jgi:hypothetical protein
MAGVTSAADMPWQSTWQATWFMLVMHVQVPAAFPTCHPMATNLVQTTCQTNLDKRFAL